MSEKPNPREPYVSQTGRPRCVVTGRREDGDRCTVVALRDSKGYALYPHGDEHLCVRLDADNAVTLGRFLTREDT